MNERWRVALAGLVAALAIPFLVIDTPESLEGIETASADEVAELLDDTNDATRDDDTQDDDTAGDGALAPADDSIVAPAAEVVIIEQAVRPDAALLASRADSWGKARSQAIEDGLVEVRPPAPSDTDLSLLPFVAVDAPDEPTDEVDEDASDEALESSDEPVVSDDVGDPVDGDEVSGEPTEPTEPADETIDEPVDDVPGEAAEPAEPVDPVDEVEDLVSDATPEESAGPTAPAQVDGRVPPPAGGPTAAQWDELRFCESTHNYQAVNNTGTFRGAYQFSRQTWDWVAGIHWPHLVGVDPAAADPAWQDIMAYTLFAMRGWDQWPICGQHLL